MSKIILASKSKARAALLKNADLEVIITSSGLDERKIKEKNKCISGKDLANFLAKEKAKIVSEKSDFNDYVIGADQVLLFNNEVWDKPKTISQAKQHLKILSGKTHHLYSAVAVYQNNKLVFQGGETATLTMRNFSDGFLDDYLSKMGDDVLTTVGGYMLEGLGAQLFEKIEGDYFTILGLPLLPLLSFFQNQGILKA